MTLPLLKTMSLLLDRMCIGELTNDPSFRSSFFILLQEEENGCTDVHRLTAIVNVALGFPISETEKQPLVIACKMLMHRFPRVRSIAAEALYLWLLNRLDRSPKNPSLDLLLDNQWDGDDTATKVREMAMEVATALDVHSQMMA